MQGGDELLSQQRVLNAPQRGRQLGEALSSGGPGVEGRDLPGGRDRLPGQQRRLRFGSLRGDPPGFAQPLRGLGDVGVTDQQIGQERFKSSVVSAGRGRLARADSSAFAAFLVRAAPAMTSRSGRYSSPSTAAQRVPRPSRSDPSPLARAPRRRSARARSSSSVTARSRSRRPQSARSLGRGADSRPARQSSKRRSRGSRSRRSRSPRAPCGGRCTSTARLRCSSASAVKGSGSPSPRQACSASVVQATA